MPLMLYQEVVKISFKIINVPFRNINTNNCYFFAFALCLDNNSIKYHIPYFLLIKNTVTRVPVKLGLSFTFIFAPLVRYSFISVPLSCTSTRGQRFLSFCKAKNWKLCNGVCLVCCCISIINPQPHSESQTSSAKVSERSSASAINDGSCFYGARSRFRHRSSSSSII